MKVKGPSGKIQQGFCRFWRKKNGSSLGEKPFLLRAAGRRFADSGGLWGGRRKNIRAGFTGPGALLACRSIDARAGRLISV